MSFPAMKKLWRRGSAMGGLSLWHLIILIAIIASVVVPMWKILPRAGLPGALALLMIVPFANWGLLWFVAFKKWPGDVK